MLPQVTDRSKVLRKPVDISVYTILSMAPFLPSFRYRDGRFGGGGGADPASSPVELRNVPRLYRLKFLPYWHSSSDAGSAGPMASSGSD